MQLPLSIFCAFHAAKGGAIFIKILSYKIPKIHEFVLYEKKLYEIAHLIPILLPKFLIINNIAP